jgi:hypothetical protein
LIHLPLDTKLRSRILMIVGDKNIDVHSRTGGSCTSIRPIQGVRVGLRLFKPRRKEE